MVRRGQRRFLAKAQHQSWAIPAKLLGQRHPRLEGVEQTPIRQIERHADLHAQGFGRLLGFGQAHFRTGRSGRRLAVGQVDDTDAVALPHQLGQRAATGDFHVVGVRAHGDHVELRIFGVVHGWSSGVVPAGLTTPSRKVGLSASKRTRSS